MYIKACIKNIITILFYPVPEYSDIQLKNKEFLPCGENVSGQVNHSVASCLVSKLLLTGQSIQMMSHMKIFALGHCCEQRKWN